MVSSALENDEGAYVIEATFIGSLAVAATSEQLCGLNVPAKDAVYRIEIQHSLSDAHVDLESFGCSFPALRGSEGIVAEGVDCELTAQSPLRGYGISKRTIVAFEFDPERDILRMLSSDLARGVAREDVELVGIAESWRQAALAAKGGDAIKPSLEFSYLNASLLA